MGHFAKTSSFKARWDQRPWVGRWRTCNNARGNVRALERHGGNGASAPMTLTRHGFRHRGHVGGGIGTGKRQRELGDARGGIGGRLGAAVLRRAGKGKRRAIALVEHGGGRLSLRESP